MSKLPVRNRSPFPRRSRPRALTIAAALAPVALLVTPGSAIADEAALAAGTTIIATAPAYTEVTSGGGGSIDLQMPSVTPEQADLYFATRVVPASDAPPFSAVSITIQPLPVAAVLGHDLPTDATTPSGMPRADFAIAKSSTNAANIALGTSADLVLAGPVMAVDANSSIAAAGADQWVTTNTSTLSGGITGASADGVLSIAAGGADQWVTTNTSTLSGGITANDVGVVTTSAGGTSYGATGVLTQPTDLFSGSGTLVSGGALGALSVAANTAATVGGENSVALGNPAQLCSAHTLCGATSSASTGGLSGPVAVGTVGLATVDDRLAALGAEVTANTAATAAALGGDADLLGRVLTGPQYNLGGIGYSSNNVGSALGALDSSVAANTAATVVIGERVTAAQGSIAANTAAIAANASATAAAMGGGASGNGGVVTGPAYTLGGGTYNNVGSALTYLDDESNRQDANLAGNAATTAAALGGGASVDANTGMLTGPTYTVQGGTHPDIGSALGSLDTQVATNVANITANTTALTALDGRVGTAEGTLVNHGTRVSTAESNIAANARATAAALGGGASYAAGVWTGPQYNLKASGYSGNDVGGALGALDASADAIARGFDVFNFRLVEAEAAVAYALIELEYNNLVQGGAHADIGSALGSLDTQVATNKANIAAGAATITANTSAITALDGRVDTAEGTLVNHGTRVSTAEGNIATNASTIGKLDTRVGTAEGNIAMNASTIGKLDTRVGAAEGNIAMNASTIGKLDTRVGAAEGNIATNASTIDKLDTRVGTAEGNIATNASTIGKLDTRVGAAEGNIATNASTIGKLDTRVGGAETTLSDHDGRLTAAADTLGVHNLRLTAAEDNLATHTASITTLQSLVQSNPTAANASAFGKGAAATAVNTTALGDGAEASALNATAVGAHAKATGDNAIAIGSGAFAGGSIAVGAGAYADNGGATFGDGSKADGNNATAVGPNARATHANAAAFGNGAATARDNQQVFGTATNTYTMAGLPSAESRSLQSGPTQLVTTDADGNLAADGGSTLAGINRQLQQHDRQIDKNTEGVAIALAMAGVPTLLPTERLAWSANWGAFEGENGFAGGFAARVDSNVQFNGGIGLGANDGTVGSRLGVRVGW